MQDKIVELSLEDFQKMIQEIKTLKKEKSDLQLANDFLNKMIKDYQEKFIRDKSTKKD